MILLTGITGNVGGATAANLTAEGVKFRAIVRSPEKVKPTIAAVNEVVEGDLGNQADVSAALEGIDRMLLVTPNNDQQATLEKSVVDLAVAALQSPSCITKPSNTLAQTLSKQFFCGLPFTCKRSSPWHNPLKPLEYCHYH